MLSSALVLGFAALPGRAQPLVRDDAYAPRFQTLETVRQLRVLADGDLLVDPGSGNTYRFGSDGRLRPDFVGPSMINPSPSHTADWFAPLPEGGFVQAVFGVTLGDYPGIPPVQNFVELGPVPVDSHLELQVYASSGAAVGAPTRIDLEWSPRRLFTALWDYSRVFPDLSLRLQPLADGGVLLGGNFSSLGGHPAPRVARLRRDGSVDTAYIADVDLGREWRGIAAFPDGSAIVAYSAGLASGPGADTSLSGPGVLSKLRADGSRDPSFSATLEDPRLFAALRDGSVLVAGAPLARLLPDGRPDTGFQPELPGIVRVLRVAPLSRGRLVVEGWDEDFRSSVVVLAADGSFVADLAQFLPSRPRLTLLDVGPNDVVHLARTYEGVGYDEYYYWYDESGGVTSTTFPVAPVGVPVRVDLSGASPVAGSPFALEPPLLKPGSDPFSWVRMVDQVACDSADRILVSGLFDSIDGVARAGLARFTAAGELDLDFVPTDKVRVLRLVGVQADGRLLAQTWDPERTFVRFQEDGGLDESLPVGSDLNRGNFVVRELTPAGEILATGTEGGREFVARFSPAGTLISKSTGLGLIKEVGSIASLPGGDVLVAGTPDQESHPGKPGVVRLKADGTVDTSFALAAPAGARFLWVKAFAHGRILAAMETGDSQAQESRVQRFLPDGSAGPEFAVNWPRHLKNDGWLEGPANVVFNVSDYGLLQSWNDDGSPDTNVAAWMGDLPGGILGAAPFAAQSSRNIYVGGSSLRRLLWKPQPGVIEQPRAYPAVVGEVIHLSVTTGDAGLVSYQWQRDGVDLPGQTSATLRILPTTSADSGAYRCVVTAGANVYISDVATITVEPATARLVNFSARSRVEPGRPQIAGLVLEPGEARPVLLRAVGAALPSAVGAPLLADPVLGLFDGPDILVSDHGGAHRSEVVAVAEQVGAFPLPVAGPDNAIFPGNSALALLLDPGAYTAVTSSGDGGAGVSLFEFYDGAPALSTPSVRNVSIRGWTGGGGDVLIGGFVIEGTGWVRLLVRAVGPSLDTFGVTAAAADPRIQIVRTGCGVVAENDDWNGEVRLTEAAREVGAFPLTDTSRDAALLLEVSAGTYTVIVSAADAAPGEVLAELYVLTP